MVSAPENAVVVGVGPDGSESAVAFAVAEARRTSRPVHLVHVPQVPASEAYAGMYGDTLDAAKAVLTHALGRTEELAAGDEPVPVTSELVDNGWLVDDLVRCTGLHRLLVMQHRGLRSLHRLFTGSVVQAVAGRARGPVLSVPQGWTEERRGVVTAAVQDATEAPTLLNWAFSEARARQARVDVLHAWWLANGYDSWTVDGSFRAEQATRAREQLDPVLTPLREEFADVPVTVTVMHARPADAVLDAAERSDLLVLGRRHHLLPLGSHLGPIVRAALKQSTAPVMVTPEPGVSTDEPVARSVDLVNATELTIAGG